MIFLTSGVVLGLSAGFAPGPLLTLVISRALKHGVKEGIKVAAAPLVTDLPIILVSTFVLARLEDVRPVLGGISIIGGLYVAFLAGETVRTTRLDLVDRDDEPQSIRTGILVNLLSPHPYLFWITVGSPMIVTGWKTGPGAPLSFVAGFLLSLVGAKILLAVIAGRSKQLLTGKAYGYLMRALGVLLFLFALLLLRDGARLIGLLPAS
jgi:threonine/homoserine/homoserine lactone efflux protein